MRMCVVVVWEEGGGGGSLPRIASHMTIHNR